MLRWSWVQCSLCSLCVDALWSGVRTYEDLVSCTLGQAGTQVGRLQAACQPVCYHELLVMNSSRYAGAGHLCDSAQPRLHHRCGPAMLSWLLGCTSLKQAPGAAYLNVMADVLSSVAGSIIPPGAEPSRGLVLAGGLHMSLRSTVCQTALSCLTALLRLHHGITHCQTLGSLCLADTAVLCAGVTVCAALPVALIVRSVRLLALVSQASVAICFGFCFVVLSIAMSPQQSAGAPLPVCCLVQPAVALFC